MPVLDANALKTDPEGAAFLRSVLRQPSASRNPFEKPIDPSQKAPRAAKLREWLLQSVAPV